MALFGEKGVIIATKRDEPKNLLGEMLILEEAIWRCLEKDNCW